MRFDIPDGYVMIPREMYEDLLRRAEGPVITFDPPPMTELHLEMSPDEWDDFVVNPPF